MHELPLVFYGLYPGRGRRVYSAADWRRNGAGDARRGAQGYPVCSRVMMCLFGLGVVSAQPSTSGSRCVR